MRKEARQLREKAVNALVLSIEHFNRPWDRGRIEAVLILLDHAFEMLLKSSIRHKGGTIRKPRETQTLGFDACVRKGVGEASVKFLTEQQALTLQAINRQRNCAQHHLIDMSEHQLYFYAQAGVTIFRDIHDAVFNKSLIIDLPERVLPISTTAPKTLTTLFDKEIDEIKALLTPGTRRKMDAIAKARTLAVLESAVNGDNEQPSDRVLEKLCGRISNGESWTSIFPGVASINITSEGDGPTLNLRLTKNEGTPVQLLKEGDGLGAVAITRRVNELAYYSLGAAQLAEHVGLTRPKSRAVVDHLGIREDDEYFRSFKIGGVTHARYSPKAIKRIEFALQSESIDDIWAADRARRAAAKAKRKARK